MNFIKGIFNREYKKYVIGASSLNIYWGLVTIKVEINITREDYWQLNKYVLMNKNKKTILTFLIGTPFILFIIFLMMKLSILYSLVSSIILGSAVNVFTYIRMKKKVIKIPGDNPGILGTHLIALSEEGISEKTDVNSNFYNWEGIYSIEESNDYIFIFINKLQCHIIPKREFNTNEEVNQFFNKAKAYFEMKGNVNVI